MMHNSLLLADRHLALLEAVRRSPTSHLTHSEQRVGLVLKAQDALRCCYWVLPRSYRKGRLVPQLEAFHASQLTSKRAAYVDGSRLNPALAGKLSNTLNE